MIVGEEAGNLEMSINEALDMADERGVDLVQVGQNGSKAVCKLIDYKKFVYDQKKREKNNNKAKQELKEIRFGPAISDNDLEIKAKSASRILSEGDKVKVSITYKGRMISFIDKGVDKLNEFSTFIEGNFNIDKEPKIEGNRVYMILSPKTSKK